VNRKDDGATFTMTAICAPQNLPKVEAALRKELALSQGRLHHGRGGGREEASFEQLVVQRTQDGSLASRADDVSFSFLHIHKTHLEG
jgi:hypothetical protein